jgi:cyclopropane-fatty-acyl-phospholipid synthase
LLDTADVRLNGQRPWDIRLLHPGVPERVLAQGSLGLGEAYMDGWWDCNQLDGFAHRALRANLDREISQLHGVLLGVRAVVSNLQSRSRGLSLGERHYELGNPLYERMLDRRMVYSCGYWAEAENLEQAQEAKLDLVCRKLGLKPGDSVLDIGCGWGGFAEYAAQHYGVRVLGLTLSESQASAARKRCAGLQVEICLEDYREIDERFDHIVSLGMFEHVGWKNYGTFMDVARRCLKEHGLFLLQTIGSNQTHFASDPWIDRHIFPNGELPSVVQLSKALEGRFVIEDWQNFGADYDLTLQAWRRNFDEAWPRLAERYGERFRRMWHYYLAVSMASFRVRRNQLWQVLLSPAGVPGGWRLQR